MTTKGTDCSSNGYIHLHGKGRCTAVIGEKTIEIETVAKGANHYFWIRGLSAKNARELARQLVMAADEVEGVEA